MDKFLGQTIAFWSGVGAIAVCVYTLLVAVTAWFLYKQVRTAARTFQLDAIQRIQQLVDDFREDRRQLFAKFPLDIALPHEQFVARPPDRYRSRRLTEDEIRNLTLREEQNVALASLSAEQWELARRIIARLNDIGELVEAGIVDKKIFLGKYHVMVIQCCHMLEAVRREDERRRGGNYGQRLLRMRHWATTYNDVSPRHREVPVTVSNSRDKRLVYQSPPPTVFQKLSWSLRWWFSLYG